MEKHTLIESLADHHRARPFWKQGRVLLGVWLSAMVLIFTYEVFFMGSDPVLTHVPSFVLFIFFAIVSWFVFSKNLTDCSRINRDLGAMLALLLGVTIYTLLTGDTPNNRSVGIFQNNVRCFNHILLSALLPVALLPFFIKYFFVPRLKGTLTFLGSHISFLAIAVLELKCHDRELWHLVAGHHSTHLVIFLFLLMFYTVRKKFLTLMP